MIIKDNEQFAYGDYESIINTGFDIEEILKSYNDALKNEDGSKGSKKEYNPEQEKKLAVTGANVTKKVTCADQGKSMK